MRSFGKAIEKSMTYGYQWSQIDWRKKMAKRPIFKELDLPYYNQSLDEAVDYLNNLS